MRKDSFIPNNCDLTLMLPGPNISIFKKISDQLIQLELLKCFVIDAQLI